MKKKRIHKVISVLLASILLCGATSILSTVGAAKSAALPFDDISNSYAQKEIVRLAELNIVNGTGERRFDPKQSVTRAEFIVMLDRLLKLEPVKSEIATFTDVRKSDWYYGWIQAGVNLNLVDGVRPGIFEPRKEISRQEVAALIVRAMKQKVGDTSKNPSYADSDEISSWAKPYVSKIQDSAIMSGDKNKFRPKDAMTRQETAVVLSRILDTSFGSKVTNGQASSKIHMGWQYSSTTAQFIKQVEDSNVNTLVPRWFYIENNGVVSDHSDKELMTYATQHNKKIWAMLGNRSDAEMTHTMLSSSVTRSKVIKQLITYVEKYNLSGINVDFENVNPVDRDYLTAFIAEFSKEMRKISAELSIDVSPDLGTDWTEAFNYSKLGDFADYVILMGYDEHWSSSPKAGSVSSFPWVESALNKLLSVVPSKKVILAQPFYTRDWTITSKGVTSEDLSLSEQTQRIRLYNAKLEWNGTINQYIATYTNDGIEHNIWTEDSRSLSAKVQMAATKGIAGYAYWYMGGDTSDIWPAIRNAIKYATY